MNDRPDAAELLEIARKTLVDDVLPRLPQELRYTGLMIANAMAIAARERSAGEADAQAELARIGTLLDERPGTQAGEALHAALMDYNRRLAEAIRAGRFDGPQRAALHDHLRKTATDKLAVANPKALKD